MTTSARIRAVLFDLDDTLFDHDGSAREALAAVHASHEAFARQPFERFSQAHGEVLEALHLGVLAGQLGIDDAREQRFRRLFADAAAAVDDTCVRTAASLYRREYIAARRPIAGAATLLTAVRRRAKVGVVTNNLTEEQREKVRCCGLEALIDLLLVSEEAGSAKPDPRIFTLALDRLDCAANEAVMIGDSWAADIVGAHRAGIRAIWFDQWGRPQPPEPPGVARITSLEPAADVLRQIFDPLGDRREALLSVTGADRD